MRVSREFVAPLVTVITAYFVYCWLTESSLVKEFTWLPQVVVTLAGLVGASWFAGLRLDLQDKDIDQRQIAADAQTSAANRAYFNSSVNDALSLMSDTESLTNSKAGQRWLHANASNGITEARLVQALLCDHVIDLSNKTDAEHDLVSKSRQTAIDLLFQHPECERFICCGDLPDLRNGNLRGIDFSDLDMRGANLAKGDFTGATMVGTVFDGSDLFNSYWSGQVGDDDRTTFMRESSLRAVEGSSCTFTCIDFTNADFQSTNGRLTRFTHCRFERCKFTNSDWTGAAFNECTFRQCDFSGANWQGVTFESPIFDFCFSITFDLCKNIRKMANPNGLPSDLHSRLIDMELLYWDSQRRNL